MNDQIKSIIRTVLKVAGAALVTKGLTDDAGLEAIIGGVIATVGIVLSHFQHKK